MFSEQNARISRYYYYMNNTINSNQLKRELHEANDLCKKSIFTMETLENAKDNVTLKYIEVLARQCAAYENALNSINAKNRSSQAF